MAGKHLAELCKAEYPTFVKYCLWLLAEVSVIAADIPEGMDYINTFTTYAYKIQICLYFMYPPKYTINAILIYEKHSEQNSSTISNMSYIMLGVLI